MVLAEAIVADVPVPPFPNSAMDGYAVRAADTTGASRATPVRLRVIGEAPAGSMPAKCAEPGLAIRIMTGAPVPDGVEAVVRFEATDEAGCTGTDLGSPPAHVAIYRAVRPGENVRPAGEDVAAGDRVLAALGRIHAAVHRRPRVAILATGDEVVDPGQPLGPGQIRNSNSSTIAALVRRSGGEPILLGVARDPVDELRGRLAEARQADLIPTSGGVSTGDYDVVKHVLRVEGAVDLWQIWFKPGKPLAFCQIGEVPVIGLSGNPVAEAFAFEQFARPAIRKPLGHRDLGLPTIRARLLDRVENHGGRRNFVRVRVEPDGHGGYGVRVAGS